MSPKLPGASELLSLAEVALGQRWEPLLDLADVAAEEGLGVYLVGGTVRDLLLGVPPRDPDLVVEGNALDLARSLVAQRGGKHLLHAAFQTAVWTDPQGRDLDLASARKERYTAPASLPVVEPGNLEEDLGRRDFSVNAMALSLHPKSRGVFCDPCGGLEDLARQALRVLHARSFHDDPTRAWRAARFATRLGFQLDQESQSHLIEAQQAGVFSLLGLERLGAELDRIAREPEPPEVLNTASDWGLLQSGLGLTDASGWARDLRRFQPVSSGLFWLALARQLPMQERESRLCMVPGGKREQSRWLNGPGKIDTCLQRLEAVDSASRAGRLLQELDETELKFAETLASTESSRWILWWQRRGRAAVSSVKGDLLLSHGAKPGPLLGKALAAALDVAREGGDHAEQLEAALRKLGK